MTPDWWRGFMTGFELGALFTASVAMLARAFGSCAKLES